MLLGRHNILITAGIVQLLICCAQSEPQGSTLVLYDADCKALYSPSYCLNGNNTCSLCTEPTPGSGCPEGFFNPSWPSSQCCKIFDSNPGRNWTEAREFCIENGLTLFKPNDDVNLGKLSRYILDIAHYGVWLGGRGSASGFLWEAGVGEQPGSSSSGSRRGLDGHPGWAAGQPDFAGNDYCLRMVPRERWSTPYFSSPCSGKTFTLCQM